MRIAQHSTGAWRLGRSVDSRLKLASDVVTRHAFSGCATCPAPVEQRGLERPGSGPICHARQGRGRLARGVVRDNPPVW